MRKKKEGGVAEAPVVVHLHSAMAQKGIDIHIRTISDALRILADFGPELDSALLVIVGGAGGNFPTVFNYEGMFRPGVAIGGFMVPDSAEELRNILEQIFAPFCHGSVNTAAGSSAIFIQEFTNADEMFKGRWWKVHMNLFINDKALMETQEWLRGRADSTHAAKGWWFGLD
ncbi:hypothetical protein HY629_02345 [Candidatus Uhrbacteria bacterium]|nr:hypothetical protein [Candidatus Uhrbacteria bacterium]